MPNGIYISYTKCEELNDLPIYFFFSKTPKLVGMTYFDLLPAALSGVWRVDG